MMAKTTIWRDLIMQICQSHIGGKSWPSSQPPIDKFYAATGELIAQVEPATT
jgi:hypothetical protein